MVLPGSEIGKCAAFARRSGKTWFIGVINGAGSHDAGLPAEIFSDAANIKMIQLGDAPGRDDAWQREEKTAKREDAVHLALRRGGGCVIELTPQK